MCVVRRCCTDERERTSQSREARMAASSCRSPFSMCGVGTKIDPDEWELCSSTRQCVPPPLSFSAGQFVSWRMQPKVIILPARLILVSKLLWSTLQDRKVLHRTLRYAARPTHAALRYVRGDPFDLSGRVWAERKLKISFRALLSVPLTHLLSSSTAQPICAGTHQERRRPCSEIQCHCPSRNGDCYARWFLSRSMYARCTCMCGPAWRVYRRCNGGREQKREYYE